MLLTPATADPSATLAVERLREEFPEVSPGMVADRVAAAAAAAALFGEALPHALPTIERIAREDLGAMRHERAR